MYNHVPWCSCPRGMIGSAVIPCRPVVKHTPKCAETLDCPSNKQCINQNCVDPCVGRCGVNSICTVEEHSPICNCAQGYTGDALVVCHQMSKINPCLSLPCGKNAECQISDDKYTCRCSPNYIGRPPNCRPECKFNSHCSSDKACIDRRCRNPCDALCGLNSGELHSFILMLSSV